MSKPYTESAIVELKEAGPFATPDQITVINYAGRFFTRSQVTVLVIWKTFFQRFVVRATSPGPEIAL